MFIPQQKLSVETLKKLAWIRLNKTNAQPRRCRRSSSARWTFASVLFALTSFGLAPPWTSAADLSAIYRDVKPSVVYISCVLSDGMSSGSGFIYASGDATSVILTANHVIEGASKIDVILDSDTSHRYEATVVKHDHVRDIAELSIPIGRRVALKLENLADVKEGMGIAAIGYPRAAKTFEKSLGDHLRPSVHSGIVSAIRLDGEVIQFDAETDHGDSGGPVIDAKSGLVIGVVRGGLLDKSYLSAGLEALPGSNFAMSASSITAVLANTPVSSAKIAAGSADVASAGDTMPAVGSSSSPVPAKAPEQATAPSTTQTQPPVPLTSAVGSSSAEYRVGFATHHYDDPSVDSTVVPLVARLTDHYKASHNIYVVQTTPGIVEESASKLAGYCDDTRINAIMEPSLRVRTAATAAKGGAATSKADVSLGLKVMDCSSEPFFVGETSAPEGATLAAHSPEVAGMLNGMLDNLIADFDRFKVAHAGAWVSLLKTGIAVDPTDGRYQSLFGFEQEKTSTDYRITTVYPGGPGAVAGIQPEDAIVAIDGKPTKGLSREAFSAMLNVPKYTLSVLRPGGATLLQVAPKKYPELQALKR